MLGIQRALPSQRSIFYAKGAREDGRKVDYAQSALQMLASEEQVSLKAGYQCHSCLGELGRRETSSYTYTHP